MKLKRNITNLLNALDDPSSALLLPFNYHKLFVWFDYKSGLMFFNNEFGDDLTELGIYPTKTKSDIMKDSEIIKYLSIRNQYH